METIIIFTNNDRIYDFMDQVSWEINQTNLATLIEVNPQKQFYLVYDLISIDDFTNAFSLPTLGNTYVLHHSAPIRTVLDELNRLIKPEFPFTQKNHNHPQTYKRLNEIDRHKQDTENLEIIFDEIKMELSGDPVLEAKLNLLHSILSGATMIKVLNKSTEVEEDKTYDNRIAAHFQALVNLRDSLLTN